MTATLADQAVAFVEEHLDVELSDWQVAHLAQLYGPHGPGDAGAVERR